MKLEKIIQSEYLYPLWRIGWLERAFFLACRKFGKQAAQKLFSDILKGHDVSYYQGYIDFMAMLASGAKFVIPRLGYGVTKDIRFDEYMAGVNGVLPNNPYHFYHPELSPVAQADKVLAILDQYQQRISRVWLDMEYEWTGAYTDSKHWKTYRDGINTVYPTGIYTRATWWDSRVGTLAAEFGRDPFWVAQYSSALTLIPKGARDVLIWQSGSPTYYAGQSSPRIDYDLWNTDYNFSAEWDTPSLIVDGYQQLRRNDADVYLWRGAPKRVHVTNTGGKLETVSSAAKRLDADFAINGDGWVGGVDVPLSYAASDGNFYQRVSFDARPYFAATQANGYSINHVTPTAPYNLVSGTRYLVKNGANVYAGSTDPNYTSVLHPRTATGITADGKIVLCVVDGRTTQSAGMTLQNLAALMLEAGAVWALEMDGGGSSAMVKSGVVQNVPSDGTERAVSNHLLIYTEGKPMSYKGTVVKTVRIRNADNTDAGGLLYAGDIVYGEVKLAYGLNRIFYNRIYRLNKPVQAWVGNSALVDGGVTLITTQAGFTDPAEVVVPPPPPPVPTGDTQINMTLKADGTIIGTWKEI